MVVFRVMILRSIILLIIVFTISGCTRDTRMNASENPTAIDFEVHQNVIIVEAFLNNRWGKFIIDTGASVSLLDFNQSKKYNFSYSVDADNRLTGFGGRTRLMKTSVVDFKIQKTISSRSYRFSASDLSGLNAVLSQSQQRVLGVLGNDFLQSHGVVIDYPKKKLLIANFE